MKKLFLLFILVISVKSLSEELIFASTERIPYIGNSLKNNGYVYELLEEVFSRKGYSVRVEYYPEARSFFLAENGRVDGVLPLYNDAKGKLLLSDGFPGDTIGLLKLKDRDINFRNTYQDNPQAFLNELNRYQIGSVRGRSIDSDFDEFPLKKDLGKSDQQNLLKLAKGRTDLIVIDKYTAADIMVSKEPQLIGKLEFIKAALAENTFHIGFSKRKKNSAKLLREFNEGLQILRDDGTLDKILASHGLKNNMVKLKEDKDKTIIKIGTVNNGDMLIMQSLSDEYERQNPNIKIEWSVLDEGILRQRLLSSLAIDDESFDVMTIGMYETPLWAKNNWLYALENFPMEYDVADLLKPVREGLSYNNQLYALPFYAESTMTYYRKDVFEKHGIKMPKNPTYEDIEKFASIIHDASNDFYGIGLRGKPGWGDNMAFLSILANSFGARWFDENWNPQLDSQEWKNAISYYSNIINKYGPPKIVSNSFNENKALMSEGKLGIWIDATVAAGMLFDSNQSKMHDKIGFAASPYSITKRGSNWLWAWALGIPASAKYPDEAQKFIEWATSKEYIKLVGEKKGWVAIPPGTRESTYSNPNYLKVAPFAKFVLSSINSADPNNPTKDKVPYTGIQFVSIPEFPAIGGQVGIEISTIFTEGKSVEEVLKKSQEITKKQMSNSGYIK